MKLKKIKKINFHHLIIKLTFFNAFSSFLASLLYYIIGYHHISYDLFRLSISSITLAFILRTISLKNEKRIR